MGDEMPLSNPRPAGAGLQVQSSSPEHLASLFAL